LLKTATNETYAISEVLTSFYARVSTRIGRREGILLSVTRLFYSSGQIVFETLRFSLRVMLVISRWTACRSACRIRF